MSGEVVADGVVVAASEAVVAVESPPAAPVVERREEDPRARLNELAAELVRAPNRRLLVEYLRARRARG